VVVGEDTGALVATAEVVVVVDEVATASVVDVVVAVVATTVVTGEAAHNFHPVLTIE
jgi:hypothetical protein